MKKTIFIFSIIGIVLSVIVGIIFIVLANTFDAKSLVENGGSVTYNGQQLKPADTEELNAVTIVFKIVFWFFVVVMVLALIVSILDIVLLSKMPASKAPYIVFGVLSIAFSIAVAGVLLIVYGATGTYKKDLKS